MLELEKTMIKLLKHQRVQIPNGIAIVAAVVLVVSSIIGFEANREAYSPNRDNERTAQTVGTETDSINNAAENKSRQFNIGSLLFRRK
jgi:hypothetical protein